MCEISKCEISKCDINQYHKDIYERYLRESHTWTKHFLQTGNDQYEFLDICKLGQSIIITALYVPEDLTALEITYHDEPDPIFTDQFSKQPKRSIRYHHRLIWSESESDTLESVLLEANRLPDPQKYVYSYNAGIRRVCIYQPFILLPYPFFLWIHDDSGYRGCCIEYFIVDTPDLIKPYPYGKDNGYPINQLSEQGQFLKDTAKSNKLGELDTRLFSKFDQLGSSRTVSGTYRFYWRPVLPAQEIPKCKALKSCDV